MLGDFGTYSFFLCYKTIIRGNFWIHIHNDFLANLKSAMWKACF